MNKLKTIIHQIQSVIWRILMTMSVILQRKAKNPVTLAVAILGFFIAIFAIIYIGTRMGIFFQFNEGGSV